MQCFGRRKSSKSITKPPPEKYPHTVRSGQMNVNDNINSKLIEDKGREEGKLRLLLLGTGESGKSTIFKQFRILYGTPKSDDDLRMYGVVARSNIIAAVTKLCELTRMLNYEQRLIDESDVATAAVPQDGCGMTVKDAYDHIMSHLVDNNATDPLPSFTHEQESRDWVGKSPTAGSKTNSDAVRCLQLADAIEVLWQSPTIQDVWMQRAAKNINDSHGSFIKDVKRITCPTYVPTEDDVLKARLRTTQVTLERYIIEGTEFEVCDVGGQRAERRKWISCFNDVNAVIFVAALSEYDQRLAETRAQNRMVEALNLFGSIVKNAFFEKTPIMLFLNKKDIFAEKIQYSDISRISHFNDYGGPPNDFDFGVLYFIEKFEEQLEGEFGDNFIHVTNATDTNNMEFVLNASRLIIMKEDRNQI